MEHPEYSLGSGLGEFDQALGVNSSLRDEFRILFFFNRTAHKSYCQKNYFADFLLSLRNKERKEFKQRNDLLMVLFFCGSIGKIFDNVPHIIVN